MPQRKRTKLYVLYARVSSDRQDVDNSMSTQEAAAARFVETHGGTIIRIYRDEAKSGKVEHRPAFQEMIRDAADPDKSFDAILVWKHSRFARNRKVSPNPPMDGARIAEGGEEVTDATVRARIRVDWRLAGGLSALLGVLIAACDGCGERDGGIGHGKKHSRTGPGASWRGS